MPNVTLSITLNLACFICRGHLSYSSRYGNRLWLSGACDDPGPTKVCVYIYIYVCICVDTYIRVYIYIYIYIYTCICISISLSLYIYIYIYITTTQNTTNNTINNDNNMYRDAGLLDSPQPLPELSFISL